VRNGSQLTAGDTRVQFALLWTIQMMMMMIQPMMMMMIRWQSGSNIPNKSLHLYYEDVMTTFTPEYNIWLYTVCLMCDHHTTLIVRMEFSATGLNCFSDTERRTGYVASDVGGLNSAIGKRRQVHGHDSTRSC
jgi:hypothetical protein